MSALAQPYDGHSDAYHAWRRQQLTELNRAQAMSIHQISHELVGSGQALTPKNRRTIESICHEVQNQGFSLYEFDNVNDDDRQSVVRFYSWFGLTTGDSGVIAGQDRLSLLEKANNEAQRRFVPYSDRAMNWHTDGYYNDAQSTIQCFCLHCLHPANSGGELTLMDDQLLLIALYDHDPRLVSLLAQPDAMCVPASQDEFGHSRPDRSAPVFAVNSVGVLSTRFTTRRHNIHWRTPETKQAMEAATDILDNLSHWHTRVRLATGQGVITRNVLHCRSRFQDADDQPGRQMLRGRYLQRPAAPDASTLLQNS